METNEVIIRPGTGRAQGSIALSAGVISAFQTVRTLAAFTPALTPQFISIRVVSTTATEPVAILFGNSVTDVAAIGADAPRFLMTDGVQRFVLLPQDQGFRAICVATTPTVYWWLS